jgi:acyl carrier protein
MSVSSRTPEGYPSVCPLCGAATNLEFSDPSGDAPCPSCGHLLWLSSNLLECFQRHFSQSLGVAPERITPDTAFSDLGVTSLDTVELVMEFEEEFDVSIPADVADRLETIGEAVRYLEEQRRKSDG